MMLIDDIDIIILRENYDESLINQIDADNVIKIFKYLKNNGVYYAKDLLLNSLDLFLYPCEEFIKKFEHFKSALGKEFVDKLGEDVSLIEIMYE